MDNKKLNILIDQEIKKQDIKNAEKIGYKYFVPFLYGLCNWLKIELNRNEINNVFFLARDGFIIKKAYETLFNNADNNNKYMYLSRRSLSLPAMKMCSSIEEIHNFLVLPPSFYINDLLDIFDIKISDEILKSKYGIEKDEIFYRTNYKDNSKILQILKDNKSKIMHEIENQSNFFLDYTKNIGFRGNVAIVDIGWHNSIQYLLNACFENEYNGKIYGYYIGVYKDSKKLPKNNIVYGYLYNENNRKSNLKYKTFAFVALLESLFLAQEGTTLKYTKNNGDIVPLLREYEYKDEKQMESIIKEIQKGAIHFCEDFKKKLDYNINMKDKMEIYNKNILKLGLSPNKEELEILSKLEFENFSNKNIINYNHSSFYYLTHLKKLKNDFYKSGWRIMFLKKLIPFPFPHYLFFKILCELFL